MDDEIRRRTGEIDDDLEADTGSRSDARVASGGGWKANPAFERLRVVLAVMLPIGA